MLRALEAIFVMFLANGDPSPPVFAIEEELLVIVTDTLGAVVATPLMTFVAGPDTDSRDAIVPPDVPLSGLSLPDRVVKD